MLRGAGRTPRELRARSAEVRVWGGVSACASGRPHMSPSTPPPQKTLPPDVGSHDCALRSSFLIKGTSGASKSDESGDALTKETSDLPPTSRGSHLSRTRHHRAFGNRKTYFPHPTPVPRLFWFVWALEARVRLKTWRASSCGRPGPGAEQPSEGPGAPAEVGSRRRRSTGTRNCPRRPFSKNSLRRRAISLNRGEKCRPPKTIISTPR